MNENYIFIYLFINFILKLVSCPIKEISKTTTTKS